MEIERRKDIFKRIFGDFQIQNQYVESLELITPIFAREKAGEAANQ